MCTEPKFGTYVKRAVAISNMQPESRVVSLETAKKLKEAGFPQETERWWRDGGDAHGNYICTGEYGHDSFMIAAPDAQEIGEQMLNSIGARKFTGCFLRFGQWGGGTKDVHEFRVSKQTFRASNEAEARAACWLYLKDHGLLNK